MNKISGKLAEEKGHIIHRGFAEITEKYDLITGFDIVEHLYDLPRFLKVLERFCVKDAKIIFFTGDISAPWSKILREKFWYYQFPEHIVFPSKKFFSRQKRFIIENFIRIHHSKQSTNSYIKELYWVIKRWLKLNWNRCSPLFPDHILISLIWNGPEL